MVNYLSILFVTFLVVLGVWYLICKYYLKDSMYYVIKENKKRFLISILVSFAFVTLISIKPLFFTARCAIRGIITNTDTQYSWIMEECQSMTVNGSYINMDRNRGLPDSNDNHSDVTE